MDAFQADFDTDQFISLIKEKENIWNYKSSSYNDKLQRYSAWISVCKDLVPDFDEKSKLVQKEIVAEAQAKWKVLRDGFSRSYKNIKKRGGKSPNAIKKYAHFNELLFLKDLIDIKYQCDDSNDSESSTSVHDVGKKIRKKQKRNAEEAITDINDKEEPEGKNVRSKQLRITLQKPTTEDILIAKFTERANEILNNPTNPLRSPNSAPTRHSDFHIPQDEDKLFLMSLQKDFSAIPEAYKLDAKFDIINVLRHYRNISSSQRGKQSSQAFSLGNSSSAKEIAVSTTAEVPTKQFSRARSVGNSSFSEEIAVLTTIDSLTEKSPNHDSVSYLKSEDGGVDEEIYGD